MSSSTSSWYQGRFNQGSCEFTGGAYQVTAQNGSFAACTDDTFNGKNFTYELDMTFRQNTVGASAGLILYSDSSNADFYYFLLGEDASYNFGVVQSSQFQQVLRSGLNNSVIRHEPGQTNQLAVVANDANFDLYVNGQHIDSVSDGAFTSGGIGVMAYDTTGKGVEVAFNNAKVWTM